MCDYARCRSKWPRGLRRRSTAARLLAILGCVLSGRGLCDELITRPEESYRLWRVVVCDRQRKQTKIGGTDGRHLQ
jgi:hypothetical protein